MRALPHLQRPRSPARNLILADGRKSVTSDPDWPLTNRGLVRILTRANLPGRTLLDDHPREQALPRRPRRPVLVAVAAYPPGDVSQGNVRLQERHLDDLYRHDAVLELTRVDPGVIRL